jgi:hypothetical protein
MLDVGHEEMKTGTAILNALLMWVFGFASAACQIKLRNVMMYPDSYGNLCRCLPPMSGLAVRIFWLWWAVPLAWGAITIAVVLARRRHPEVMSDLVQFHTSATLLVGVFMFGFFAVAGTMPFVSIVAGLK